MEIRVRAVDAAGERDVAVVLPDDASVADLAIALGGATLHGRDGVLSGLLDGGPVCDGDLVGIDRPLPTPDPPGSWDVRVLSGPDAGRVVRLAPGEHRVLGTSLTVTDDGVDGWAAGVERVVGARLLAVGRPTAPVAAPGPSRVLHRPPRWDPPAPPTSFRLPVPPTTSDRPPWPWLLVLLPAVLGVVTYLVTGMWQTLLFLALSPLLALGAAATGRRQHRRRERRERTDHARRRAAVVEAAREADAAHAALGRARAPDPAALLDLVGTPRTWERRPGDADVLALRVGTADQPSPVAVNDPERADHEGAARAALPDLPVVLHLARLGVVGVVGPHRERVAAWMVAQAAALHAPGDLGIDAPWPWTAWLPHDPSGETVLRVIVDGADPRAPAICLAEVDSALPAACRAVVVTGDDGLLTVRRDGASDLAEVRPDLLVDDWADLLARRLAPLRDDGGAGGVPDHVTVGPLTPDQVARAWRDPGRGTRAVIGAGAGGSAFALDLARDGPHALVAGTTGAGKSVLLRTWVLALARALPPDELSLVLVDYKGGAAFRECDRLPHVSGVVTDLDPALTRRALTSLGAELRRRERVLAEAGAADLADLPAGVLARLVIVVDEFATLAAELPAFVAGLVDVARRGRSLGVHLVLATQRPSGVVTPEIRANTALRIALRVADPEDSVDVVAVPDAARLSERTPGRALVRRGPDAAEVVQFASLGRAGRVAPGVRTLGAPPAVLPDDEGAASFVDAVVEAAGGIEPAPSPWLAPLPERVVLDDLDADGGVVPFGLVDRPSEQRRGVAALDLRAGRHLAVAGASRSGRTQALRTIAGAVASGFRPGRVHLYAIDCGGGGLLPLTALPHVGVVVTRGETRRLERLLDRLGDLVEERQRGADGVQVVVLLDRWETFVQTFDGVDGGRLVEAWLRLLRDGPGVGLTAVVTGDRTPLHGRVGALLDDLVLLRPGDVADYAAVGVAARDAPVDQAPGRGFTREGHEVQVALLADDPSDAAQVAALRALGRQRAPGLGSAAFRLDDLPLRIDRTDAVVLPGGEPGLLLAVGGDRLGARCVDPEAHGGGFLVVGARRTGRSTALVALAESARAAGRPVHVLCTRASPVASMPGVRTDLDLDADAVLLVDDVDALDPDDAAAAVVHAHLERVRDGPGLVAAAGDPAGLAALYRGPVPALRRGGHGLLLAPRSSAEPDLLGVRLPRSAFDERVPPGGGHLVRGGDAERVQVVAPAGTSTPEEVVLSRR